MEDWLNDALMKFNKRKGCLTYRKPKKDDTKAGLWQSFHFATRLKMEGAVHFCRQMRGAASLPVDKGMYLLAHRQVMWYADAFFFELRSAYDTLLQELNIIYCDVDKSKVNWGDIKSGLPLRLLEIMEKEWEAKWFKEVRSYRNMGTHQNLVRMEESITGFSEEILDAELDEIRILCIDEQTKTLIRKDIRVSEEYITKMAKHIGNVWSQMGREFKK